MADKVHIKIEQALPWSFLGVLLTILIGAPPIFLSLREKKPDVTFEITSDYNILDVHKPLKDLSILFRGQNIQENKLNLRIYSLTIRNDGETDIKQSDFDQSKPWGLSISGAQIIEQPRLVYSNSKYILEELSPKIVSSNEIDFNKIIFERGKYFTIEIQVIHQASTTPEIIPIGKVAGLESQNVVRHTAAEPSASFWQKVFVGTVTVQLVRTLIYLIGSILLSIGLIALAVALSDVRDRNKDAARRRRLEEHLAPILAGKNSSEKKVVEMLVLRYRGNVDGLRKLLKVVESVQSGNKIEGLADLMKAERHLMLSERLLPGDILFSDGKEDPLLYSKEVKDLLPQLIDFLASNPVSRELLERIPAYVELKLLDEQIRSIQEKSGGQA